MNRLGIRGRDRHRLRAFTLVELLVVMVIIAVLVGLLLPAVGIIRRMARATDSDATLRSIGTGLEQFKSDGTVGGGYPPSFPDDLSGGNRGRVANPYGTGQIEVSGAGLLVWALTGADMLGSPGFKPLGNAAFWAASMNEAYSLDAGGQPRYPRRGPYMDSGARMSKPLGPAAYIVPGEIDEPTRPYAMYLDGFGYPILYWKADTAGRQMADQLRGEANQPRGIYHHEDNWPLVNNANVGGANPVLRFNEDAEHALDWSAQFRSVPPTTVLNQVSFPRYIRNTSVMARFEPQQPNGYLLISPGHDGVYGTVDDITNIKHNGR